MRRLVPNFLLLFYHWALSFLATVYYGFPSRKLIVIGVTGTNGKSTVVDLTHRIFETAGFSVASASSLRFIIADREWLNESKMTMPGRFFMQKFLWQATQKKCAVVILEVTSEGVRQFRHAFIDFDTVGITNLTPEHIESHGGFEKYREAKLKLFRALSRSRKPKRAVAINAGMQDAEMFASAARGADIKYYGRDDELKLNLKLEGEFNKQNALLAAAIASAHGVAPEIIKRALENAEPPPGRLEYVVREPFAVVVDYAHTPDALTKVYETLRSGVRHPSRMICVLGAAGGGRDKWKRPELGKIADKFCDEIILTDEDPYDEDPQAIINDVKSGVSKHVPEIILDRKEAIEAAIKKAAPGDTVIITGKGAEPLMAIAHGKKIPWDDRQIARAAIDSLHL